MTSRIGLALGLLLNAPPCWAGGVLNHPGGPPTYASHVRGEVRPLVTVYDRRTGHIVWRRRFAYASDFTWSPDRRAFAFSMWPRLVIWRAGEQVRILRRLHCQQSEFDESLLWSQDNRRLLVLSGDGAFEGTYDIGDLFCLDLNTGRDDWIAGSVAGQLTMPYYWRGRRTVIYRKRWPYFDVHNRLYLVLSPKCYSYRCHNRR